MLLSGSRDIEGTLVVVTDNNDGETEVTEKKAHLC